MVSRKRKLATLIAVVIILVAIFQFLWPFVYDSPFMAQLNPYPTQEYLRIVGFFSPNGLSALTVIIGLIFLTWVAYTDP